MRTILLLIVSNIFMTFAWYGHLKLRGKALWKVILASGGSPSSNTVSKCWRTASALTNSTARSSRRFKKSSLSRFSPFSQLRIWEKDPMELRRGLRVHRARRLLRLSQVARMNSGDSGEALQPRPAGGDFLQNPAHPPKP